MRNVWAWVEAPTEKPSRMVTTSISELRAVLASRSVTMDSLSRLPKKSMPSSVMEPGAMRPQMRKATMGKMIFSFLETCLGGFI